MYLCKISKEVELYNGVCIIITVQQCNKDGVCLACNNSGCFSSSDAIKNSCSWRGRNFLRLGGNPNPTTCTSYIGWGYRCLSQCYRWQHTFLAWIGGESVSATWRQRSTLRAMRHHILGIFWNSSTSFCQSRRTFGSGWVGTGYGAKIQTDLVY